MIYLDNAATTAIRPQVMNVGKAVERVYGNAGTMYQAGQRAREIIEDARERIARHIHAGAEEARASVFFTSGATEGNNWCIRGTVDAWLKNQRENNLWVYETNAGEMVAPRAGARFTKPMVMTDRGEHHSVLNPIKDLVDRGQCTATWLMLDKRSGAVNAEHLLKNLTEDTALVSVMLVNNETGVRNPVEEIGRGIMLFNSEHKRHVLFHVDATQAVGKMDVDVKKIGCDMLTASGHKFHAGKGRGFVYIRPGAEVANLMHGGGQQMGRRPGTEDTVAAACLAEALDREWEACGDGRLGYLTTRTLAKLSMIEGSHFNGIPSARSGIISVWFEGVESEALLTLLERHGVICSAGSACTTGENEPSHVLVAMGAEEEALRGTIRVSVGAMNTLKEIEKACEEIGECVNILRGICSQELIWE